MAANITSSNIKVYQKKKHLNIGIVIFGVIFIYLLVTVLMYLTAKHISVYEVREGSIVKDTSYTGLVGNQSEYTDFLRKLYRRNLWGCIYFKEQYFRSS